MLSLFAILNILLLYIWSDPGIESRNGYFYIPRDELLGHVKPSDFAVNTLKSASEYDTPQLRSLARTQNDAPEFNSFDEVLSLFGEPPKFSTPLVIQGIS